MTPELKNPIFEEYKAVLTNEEIASIDTNGFPAIVEKLLQGKIVEKLKNSDFSTVQDVVGLRIILEKNPSIDRGIISTLRAFENPKVLGSLVKAGSNQQLKTLFDTFLQSQRIHEGSISDLNNLHASISSNISQLKESTQEPVSGFNEILGNENFDDYGWSEHVGKVLPSGFGNFGNARENLGELNKLSDINEMVDFIGPIVNGLKELDFSEIEHLAKNSNDPTVKTYFEKNQASIKQGLEKRNDLVNNVKEYYSLLAFEYNYYKDAGLFNKDANGKYTDPNAEVFIKEVQEFGNFALFLDGIQDMEFEWTNLLNINILTQLIKELWGESKSDLLIFGTLFLGSTGLILGKKIATVFFQKKIDIGNGEGEKKLVYPNEQRLDRLTKKFSDLGLNDIATRLEKLKGFKGFLIHTDGDDVFSRKVMQAIIGESKLGKVTKNIFFNALLDLRFINNWANALGMGVNNSNVSGHPILDTSIKGVGATKVNLLLIPGKSSEQLDELEKRIDLLVNIQTELRTKLSPLGLDEKEIAGILKTGLEDSIDIKKHQIRYVVEQMITSETNPDIQSQLIKQKNEVIERLSETFNGFLGENRLHFEIQNFGNWKEIISKVINIKGYAPKIVSDGIYDFGRNIFVNDNLKKLLTEGAEDFKKTYGGGQDIGEVIFKRTIQEKLFSTIDSDNKLIETSGVKKLLLENINTKNANDIKGLVTLIRELDQYFILNQKTLPDDFDMRIHPDVTRKISDIVNNADLDFSNKLKAIHEMITGVKTDLTGIVEEITKSKIKKESIDGNSLNDIKKSVEKLKTQKLLDSITGDFNGAVKAKVEELIIKGEKIKPENAEGIIKKLVEIDTLFKFDNPRASMFIDVTLHHMETGKDLLAALTELEGEIKKVVAFNNTNISEIDSKLNDEINKALIESDNGEKIKLIKTNLEHVKTITDLPNGVLKDRALARLSEIFFASDSGNEINLIKTNLEHVKTITDLPDLELKERALARLSKIFFDSDGINIIKYVEKYNELVGKSIPVKEIDENFNKTTLEKIETSYNLEQERLKTTESRQHDLEVAQVKAKAELPVITEVKPIPQVETVAKESLVDINGELLPNTRTLLAPLESYNQIEGVKIIDTNALMNGFTTSKESKFDIYINSHPDVIEVKEEIQARTIITRDGSSVFFTGPKGLLTDDLRKLIKASTINQNEALSKVRIKDVTIRNYIKLLQKGF